MDYLEIDLTTEASNYSPSASTESDNNETALEGAINLIP